MRQRQRIPSPLLDPEGDVLSEEVFLFTLTKEIWRSVRYRQFFSVCLVGVNSMVGNLRSRGRPFLLAVSRVLGEKLRRTDEIGLLSEGFGILLLNVADQPAVTVAERLRIYTSEVAVPGAAQGRVEPLTISVGGACFPRDGQTGAALLTHASRCLQAAWRRGGDRVVYDLTRP